MQILNNVNPLLQTVISRISNQRQFKGLNFYRLLGGLVTTDSHNGLTAAVLQ